MEGEKKERWLQLCQQIVNEKNPETFYKLVEELNALLAEQRQQLVKNPAPEAAPGRKSA
jgi:hypothetical protein